MASLADIILEGGREQAQSQLQLAQIEANRRNANSQNITQSIATLADVFGKIPQQIAQNKRQAVEDQTNQLALDQLKQGVQGQADINQIIATLKPNEDGVLTFDPAQLRQSFAAKNIPLALQTQTFAALDGMNKSLAGFTQARIDHAADFSNSVLAAFPTGAIDPQSLMLIMAPAKANGLLDDKTEKAITTAVQNGADPRQLLTAFRDQSEKYKGKAVSVASGAKLVNDTTGAVIAESAPRPVSVAPGASLVNPDTNKAVFTAPPSIPPGSAEQDDQRYRNIQAALFQKQPVSPADIAWSKGYEQQKTLGPEASAAAASNRQAATIAQQIAQQGRTQDFTEKQAGRSELTNKVEQPYQDAVEKASTLRSVIDAAQHGNMAAANVQPLLATLGLVTMEGVKRINTTELTTVSGAGSLLERIKGEVGGLVGGQPISPKIQSDLKELADALEKSARDKYLQGFNSVTKRYGLNDERPLVKPDAATKPTAEELIKKYGAGK